MNLVVQLSFLMLRHFKDFPQPCSWGICWAFGSSQGLIWKITPFKRSIGIIPRINTQPHSKIVLSLKYSQAQNINTFREAFSKHFLNRSFSVFCLSLWTFLKRQFISIERYQFCVFFLSFSPIFGYFVFQYVAVHLLPNLFWVQQSALLKDQNSSAASSLSCMVLILDSL